MPGPSTLPPRRGATALLALTLAACAGGPLPPSAGQSPAAVSRPDASASSRPPGAAAMAVERQWLQSWFDGTPVAIAQRPDGRLTVDVPRDFCFDRGASTIKPALGAVLDKVAESLRRRPDARVVWLAAPGDDASNPRLAVQRAAQVRRHLLGRGVPAERLAAAAASPAPAVQLQLGIGAWNASPG